MLAVQEPVKYGILFAALVSHAKAASSASYACTSVPITSHKVVLAALAFASSISDFPKVLIVVVVNVLAPSPTINSFAFIVSEAIPAKSASYAWTLTHISSV